MASPLWFGIFSDDSSGEDVLSSAAGPRRVHNTNGTSGEASDGPSDAVLIARIQRGEHAAFEQLFRTYAKRLCGFAYRFVHEHAAAEEIVQDVFLNIWRRHQGWDVPGTVKAYLFLAVRNTALKRLDRTRHELAYRERYEVPEELPSPDTALSDAELDAVVERAIASLPERARLVFTLVREQGMPHREVAEILGITQKTVENQMTRAIHLLRERLAPYWG